MQDQNQRQPPLISLTLLKSQLHTNSIPLVFRPIKENGTVDFRTQRSFDSNGFLVGPNYRQKKTLFEMKLPYSNVHPTTTSQAISAKPYSPQDFPNSILFSIEHLELVFSKLTEEYGITISSESVNKILNFITKQLYEILIRAAQSSRQRTNVYMPPVAERDITSTPKIKQNFLDFEVLLANNIRTQLFKEIDDENLYKPYFYTNFDIKKADLFPHDANEKNEQTIQMRNIFHTLKYRGEMYKTVAHEAESTFSHEIDKYISNTDKIPISMKQAPFNPKANEIFGEAEEEEKRKKERKIIPKDIFEALSRMNRLFQSEIPLWKLKYFTQAETDFD